MTAVTKWLSEWITALKLWWAFRPMRNSTNGRS